MKTMSEVIILKLVDMLVPTLTVLAAIFATWVNSRSGRKKILTSVQEVHDLADGQLSKALRNIELLQTEVSRLNAGGAPTRRASDSRSGDARVVETDVTRDEGGNIRVPQHDTPTKPTESA